jgi:16S rRNA (uracil1498-N3)-methyltransferase
MLSERPEATPLRKILRDRTADTVALAIGPEGGWTNPEFSAAEQAGFEAASLGSLILRTETTVTACLASLNYALDNDGK